MRRGFGVALAFGASVALTSVAEAETRALVVGVSGYPALAEALRLTGPKNDTREFTNTIVRLGVPAENVTVLADGVRDLAAGVDAPGPGTKAAILAGLDRLAEESRAGDLVVFYFSGHGSQQPDLDGDEQGGADEIILPYDVGKWGKDGVENALIDDELRARIDRILDKGADFFGVIDACHSATGFRDLPGSDVRSRQVDPADLGVPALASAEARHILSRKAGEPGNRGRAAFFYAAQESEEALEKVPPNGEEGQNFGVFTYNLVRRMNETPNLTYRNLHQAVMADIKRNTLMSTQTPEIEGELIDEPVLQLGQAPARRQWRIFNGKLQGGRLDGIAPGAVVGLVADPAADAVLAYGVVTEAGATKSVVAPTAYPCAETREDGSCAISANEEGFRKGRFAGIVEPGVDLSVTFSEPVRLDPADGHDYSRAIAAFHAALASEPLRARSAIRASGYDVAVGLVDGKLAFSSSPGAIDANGRGSSPRLTLPDDPDRAAAGVAEAIGRIGKVLALQRLGNAVEGSDGVGLSTELKVAKARPGALRDGACSEDDGDYEPQASVGDSPRFGECDVVSIVMRNGGSKPLDVTVLLAAADFSLTPVWPQDGASSRILASESKTARILQMAPNAPAAADERLIFIAVPGVGRANVVFDNLEQEGLRAAPDDPTAVAAARDLLAAGLNDTSRTAMSAPAAIEEELSISVTPFHVEKGGG